MAEGYGLVKYFWQHLLVDNLNGFTMGFNEASSRKFLLPKLAEIIDLPTSILELGAMYNPWVESLANLREINRVHLSDPMYMTRGYPQAETIGVIPENLSCDAYGLPELLDTIPNLGLGDTTLILANVVNYIDKVDIERLLEPIGEEYDPRIIVIGNKFEVALGHSHENKLATPEECRRLLASKGFRTLVEEAGDSYMAGIYRREDLKEVA